MKETVLKYAENEPVIIAIDDEWGVGKTTYLEKFKEHLKQKKQKAIYFNSWQHDITKNPPLIPLFLEIVKELKLESAPEWTSILKKSLALGVNAMLEKFGIPNMKELEKISETFYIEIFEKYESEKKLFEEIKTYFAIELKKSGPIFFFIDELDRCRPTFSIELLESVKHFFNITGIIFILGIHKEQLAHSIKSIYGNEFDGEGYLDRFIDLEFHIPRSEGQELANFLFEKYQLKKYIDIKNKFNEEKIYKMITSIIGNFFVIYQRPFRISEKTIKKIKFLYASISYEYDDLILLSTFFLMVKVFDKRFYNNLRDSNSRKNLYNISGTEGKPGNILLKTEGLREIFLLILSKNDLEFFINKDFKERSHKVSMELMYKHFGQPSSRSSNESGIIIDNYKDIFLNITSEIDQCLGALEDN